jgi:lactoylglutathione lyase
VIEHAAAWVSDLSRARAFYERWFAAQAAPMYSSASRPFQSHFLSFGGGARLELMVSPGEPARQAHIAVSVGSREAVDRLVERMRAEGVAIVGEPRETGDGYCEAVIADSEGNLVEITG